MAELDAERQALLLNMALVHPGGITKRTFKEWCGLGGWGWLSEHGRSVSMHPLVPEVVLSSAPETPSACEQFLREYKKYLTRDLSQMAFSDRQDWRTKGLWTASKLLRYYFLTEAVCDFYTGLGRLLQSLYDAPQAVTYTKRAVELAERLYGPGSAKLVARYNNYGAALSSAGDQTGADEYYNKALKILEPLGSLSGTQRPHGIVLSNIAGKYNQRGQFKEAEEYYKKALDAFFAQGESEAVVIIHRNLGQFYMNTGKLSAVYEHLQTALQIQLDAGREHSTRTIDVYDVLEKYHLFCKQYEKAKEIILHAIELEKELTGGESVRMAVLYYDLSAAEIDLGDYDAALLHLENAAEIFQRFLPEGDAKLLSVQNARGALLLRQGNFAEAERLYQARYAQQKKYPDGNNRDIANTCVNLSSAYRGLGNFSEAEKYVGEGLSVLLAMYGERHQMVAAAYSSLGETQRMAGKLDAAIESLTKSLEIRNNLFGEKHISTALVHQRLGAAYRDRGDDEAAVQEYAAALEIYEDNSSKKLDVKLAMDELSRILIRLGRAEEAERYRFCLE